MASKRNFVDTYVSRAKLSDVGTSYGSLPPSDKSAQVETAKQLEDRLRALKDTSSRLDKLKHLADRANAQTHEQAAEVLEGMGWIPDELTKDLQRQVADLRQQVDARDMQIEQSAAAQQDLEARVAERDSTIELLQRGQDQRMVDLEVQLRESQEKFDQSEAERQSLEASVADRNSMAAAHKQRADEAEEARRLAVAKQQDLEKQLREHASTIHSLGSESSRLQAPPVRSSKGAEGPNLQDALNEKEKEAAVLSTRLLELHRQVKRQSQDMSQDRHALQSEVLLLKGEVLMLQARVSANMAKRLRLRACVKFLVALVLCQRLRRREVEDQAKACVEGYRKALVSAKELLLRARPGAAGSR